MVTTIVALVVGIFVGWNLPQPEFAKKAQDAVVSKVKALLGK